MINHGIFVNENPTSLAVPVSGTAGLQVVVGTAPVNMGDKPEAAVNVPVLANSYSEAVQQLGYSDDFSAYTLCQSMYASWKMFNVSPVVFINVLDPDKHKKELVEMETPVTEKQATIRKTGIILKGLTVKNSSGGTTLEAGKDFTTGFDENGYLVLTLLEAGKAADATSVKVSGSMLDPSKVTASDIIGGYDAATGKETGIEVVRKVYPRLNVVPGTILAPGWSHIPEVGAALQAKTAGLNGIFKCIALLDLDTEKAKKYTDTKQVKEDSGYQDKNGVVLWPMDAVSGKILYKSATVGALLAYVDADNDNVPSLSPSNKLLKVTGQVLKDGTEVDLDQQQAGTVNSYGVVTAINMSGWKLWGNYTAAYPTASDVKDIWIMVRRMFNWHANTFIQTYMDKVDDPANYRLIETVVDSENIRCASLAPDKWAGGEIEFNLDENPITNIIAGKIKFRQRIAPYVPAQEITDELEYDVDMLQAAIGGGE